jgi:hypothetical protein
VVKFERDGTDGGIILVIGIISFKFLSMLCDLPGIYHDLRVIAELTSIKKESASLFLLQQNNATTHTRNLHRKP